jgi:hypothetical protein
MATTDKPADEVATERGWLIERAGEVGAMYWAGPGTWWTYDSLQAVRFARAADAHRVAKLLTNAETPHQVVEHAWSAK